MKSTGRKSNIQMISIGEHIRSLRSWCEELELNMNEVNLNRGCCSLSDREAICLTYVESKGVNEKDLEIHELKRCMALLMSSHTIPHYDNIKCDMYYTIDNSFPVGICAIKAGITSENNLISTKDLAEFIANENLLIEIIKTGLSVMKG